MNKSKPILVSVSGGRTSAFMAVYLKELYPNREFLFLFANTGRESESTLIFLNQLENHFKLPIVWLEAVVKPQKGVGTGYRIVDFNSASRNGEPFEDVIKKYGLPSKLYRHCTRELKEVPIHKYAKKVFGKEYLIAIGIRSDEKHRLGSDPKKIYPLASINVDKKFINDWWSKQPFDLQLLEHQGNCDFCFLKSQKKRVILLKEGLNVDWWNKVELKYGTEKQPIFDVRNNLAVKELINLNKTKKMQLSLLDDISFDCYCKAN